MIITKCPLRVSLVGGSTDLQDFIDHYGKGSVISFPVNLYTYITVSSDIYGPNKRFGQYIINYTKREEERCVKNIKNDIAREVIKYFNCKQIICTFYSDILSSGSGLASSSSYTLSMVKAISKFNNIKLSDYEICKIAFNIEHQFNKHAGYQDIYGCGIGSLKKIDFKKNEDPKFTYLSQKIFNDMNMYLISTNITRQSDKILPKLDLEKRLGLLSLVSSLEQSIIENNQSDFFNILNESWIKKKETSSLIYNDTKIRDMDEDFTNDNNVLAHKLCGAGAGGFFLVCTKSIMKDNKFIPIEVSENGITHFQI